MNCHFPFGNCLFCITNTHPFLLNVDVYDILIM
nr:MAG TPA: hypothetical protein [Caudoviricetes sp.]